MQNEEYIDDYPTCEEAHATFRVMTPQGDFGRVSEVLAVTPTSVSERDMKKKRPGAWFLESEGEIESLDSRRHIDWLLNKISDKAEEIKELRKEGYRFDITCYWRSKTGHGGPILSPKQMRVMSDLEVEIWYDVYMGGDDEE